MSSNELIRGNVGIFPMPNCNSNTVIGKTSDPFADSPVRLVNLSKRSRWEGLVGLDSDINPVDRKFTVAKCVWHVRIQLGHHRIHHVPVPVQSRAGRMLTSIPSETFPSRGTEVWIDGVEPAGRSRTGRGTSDKRIGR